MLDLNIAVYGSFCNHLFFRVLSLFFFSYYLMASPKQDEMPRNIKRKKRENETKNWPVLQLNSPLACSSVWMILIKTAVFLLSLSSLLSLPYLFICVNNIHKESIYVPCWGWQLQTYSLAWSAVWMMSIKIIVEYGISIVIMLLPCLSISFNDIHQDPYWALHYLAFPSVWITSTKRASSMLSMASAVLLPGLSICMNNIHK